MNGQNLHEQKKVNQFRQEMKTAMEGKITHGGNTHKAFIDLRRRAWKWATGNKRRQETRVIALRTIQGMHLQMPCCCD